MHALEADTYREFFEDVPPYSVVLGNPGKIVKENCISDVEDRFDFL